MKSEKVTNAEFNSLYKRYCKRAGLVQDDMAHKLICSRQTINNQLIASGPIKFDFVVRTSAIFNLTAQEMSNYLSCAGYDIKASCMQVVWDLIEARDADIAAKNKILINYSIDAIR